MQLTSLFPTFDHLHEIHGDTSLTPIYGAGEINSPQICLIFMNPTAKNVASAKQWAGLKAPWIGTKNVWRLLFKLGLFDEAETISAIETMRPEEWSVEFAENLYKQVAQHSLYITNIAKCTQLDARPLPDKVFREYLPSMYAELKLIKPKLIIAMGNQVNSTLLSKPISVSQYLQDEYEELQIESAKLKVYPTYYPIGQGTRNMPLALSRMQRIMQLEGI